MAKKKKKQRRPQSAAVATAPKPSGRSGRTDRKELARQEREAIQREIRRRERRRKLLIWGGILLVIALIAFYFINKTVQDNKEETEFADLAAGIGCGEVQDDPDEGRGHLQPGQPAPTYGNVPATSGTHSPTTLPSDVHVYDDPVPEEQAVHNLEHGYVMIYYTADALDQESVDGLASLAEDKEEVILAPHPSLPDGENLAFASWTRSLHCTTGDDDSSAEVVEVAEGYIGLYLNDSAAPEANV